MIDYRTERFEDRARDLDVVFDAVGGESLKRSWSLLNQRGRMVTIAADSDGTKDERIEKAFFIVEPNHKQLTEPRPSHRCLNSVARSPGRTFARQGNSFPNLGRVARIASSASAFSSGRS